MTTLTPGHAIALLERRHDGGVHTIGWAFGCDWDRVAVERFIWNAEHAPALVEQPFVPDPLRELRRIAADDGIDLHDLAPGNGEWVVRVVDAKIVEWGRKIEPA